MYTGICVSGSGAKSVTGHQANFAVRDRAFSDEMNGSAHHEIALHFFKGKLELVVARPDISTRTGEGISLIAAVVSSIAGKFRHADIGMPLKNPDAFLRSSVEGSRQQ